MQLLYLKMLTSQTFSVLQLWSWKQVVSRIRTVVKCFSTLYYWLSASIVQTIKTCCCTLCESQRHTTSRLLEMKFVCWYIVVTSLQSFRRSVARVKITHYHLSLIQKFADTAGSIAFVASIRCRWRSLYPRNLNSRHTRKWKSFLHRKA